MAGHNHRGNDDMQWIQWDGQDQVTNKEHSWCIRKQVKEGFAIPGHVVVCFLMGVLS
jgi:hypothetical protein